MSLTCYRNGRIYSPATPGATAVAFTGETIVFVGSEAAAADLRAEREIDLAGAWVSPAFVDAHVHCTETGLVLTGLDLSGATSLADCLARVSRDSQRGEPVLRGHGWDESGWPERRGPTPAELDRAAAGRPVYLARADLHTAACSSALLAAAGVGVHAGGGGMGLVTGEAHHRVRRAVNAGLSELTRTAAQRAALTAAAAAGIGCLHEMAGPGISSEADLAALLALSAGEDVCEVVGYWSGADVETARELGCAGAGGDLFTDGSLGARTAALREAYHDAPASRGELLVDAEAIAAYTRRARAAGLPTAVHAIGDRALDAVIAGWRAGQVGPGCRVEHAECADGDHRRALAELGAVASVQPAFDARWGGPGGLYEQRLGTERAASMNDFAALAGAGVTMAFGSDAPVTPLDPWAAVRAAWRPHRREHGLSARAAFAAATRGGWRAVGRPAEGVLAPGARASLAVWELTGGLVVQTPDSRVRAWSTDPQAGVPGLPDLSGAPPRCLALISRGRLCHDTAELGVS